MDDILLDAMLFAIVFCVIGIVFILARSTITIYDVEGFEFREALRKIEEKKSTRNQKLLVYQAIFNKFFGRLVKWLKGQYLGFKAVLKML